MKNTILRALKKSAAAVVATAVLCAAYLGICTNQVNADGYNQGIVTFVTSLYADCLGRNPDPVGLNDWCAKLASGQITGKQCAYGFFFSPEFQAKANNMSDDAFIEAYYRVFLNRTSDPNGKAYWAGKIANTTNDISILFTGFADSVEFANKCASYGITAGPHINVPTTVRGASGGGTGGGGSRAARLQSAAESAYTEVESVARAYGWTITRSVARATDSQYSIYVRCEIAQNCEGDHDVINGFLQSEYLSNGELDNVMYAEPLYREINPSDPDSWEQRGYYRNGIVAYLRDFGIAQ